ncbi:hypothetical protein SVAN01_06980 [Stagonosporopsis vannaccii]|nr:hypothetical protein SVAN01_06980 [Stagonosporopsis vannaccii]
MAYLLGWKDVLRPIRDGYRHIFPSPDTAPTPEERRKQRAIDRLKGFTYFDTFEQLEAWTEAEADSLQQANTPLLVRSVYEQERPAKASILLCHDYAGNYHDYEGALNVGLGEERYTCEYLQHVDTFVYFSHKLACVPPPSWINTLHRNGVKALGTILIEPQTSGFERLFHHGNDGLSFPLATTLARIADHCGFDGWLVNIEKSFPTAIWNTQILASFLNQLRSDLGIGKQLIWYDALTTSNKVSYQNALNAENSVFAKACGGILTNYCWKEKDAEDSIREAFQNNLPLRYVYFGIDVWAQNATMLSQPRVTYPEYGGGGTNTGVAVAKLAELGLSAGIFAPAWTFEHFPHHGRGIEQAMWDGGDLPKDIACSCGNCNKRHRPNRTMPVTGFANLSNSGSKTFFFTDFTRAFGTHSNKEKDKLFNGQSLHAQLGSQSVLPLRPESLGIQCSMRHRTEDVRGRSHLVVESCGHPLTQAKKDAASTKCSQLMPLFKLNMPADGSLQLRISYRDLTGTFKGIYFYMRISGTTRSLMQSDPFQIDHLIDVTIEAGDTVSQQLAEVDYICVQPIGSYPSRSQSTPSKGAISQPVSLLCTPSDASKQSYSIFNVHMASHGGRVARCTRLSWSHRSDARSAHGMPYSTSTGSFSYFAIYLDEMFLGRAYAAEHELPTSFIEQSVGHEVLVNVKGVGFDGRELASVITKIRF